MSGAQTQTKLEGSEVSVRILVRPNVFRARLSWSFSDEAPLADPRSVLQSEIHSAAGINFRSHIAHIVLR